MDYLWDTNVLVNYVRDDERFQRLQNKYDFSEKDTAYISVISVGEINSFAIQNKWGAKKMKRLETLFDSIKIFPIFRTQILSSYANIDAYSQNKLPNIPLPKGLSARNMGKNDIWIAATAHALQFPLLTSDKDFTHLDKVFLDLVMY